MIGIHPLHLTRVHERLQVEPGGVGVYLKRIGQLDDGHGFSGRTEDFEDVGASAHRNPPGFHNAGLYKL
jgi:hypothetical protein